MFGKLIAEKLAIILNNMFEGVVEDPAGFLL